MSAPCLRARLASSTRSPTLRLPRDPTTFQDHSAPLGRGDAVGQGGRRQVRDDDVPPAGAHLVVLDPRGLLAGAGRPVAAQPDPVEVVDRGDDPREPAVHRMVGGQRASVPPERLQGVGDLRRGAERRVVRGLLARRDYRHLQRAQRQVRSLDPRPDAGEQLRVVVAGTRPRRLVDGHVQEDVAAGDDCEARRSLGRACGRRGSGRGGTGRRATRRVGSAAAGARRRGDEQSRGRQGPGRLHSLTHVPLRSSSIRTPDSILRSPDGHGRASLGG